MSDSADSGAGGRAMDRRRFLHLGAVGLPGTLLAERLLRDPWGPLPSSRPRSARPIRIRGRVVGGEGGLAGVALSDGRQVVATDADGTFEMVTDRRGDFLRLTVPAGHRVPRHPTGTAHFYRTIRGDAGGEMTARFELERLELPDDRHAVVVLADPQTETPEEMGWFHERTVPDVRETIRGLGDVEVLGVAAGDIMYDHLDLYPDYERAVKAMGIPFFQVVGNHDLDPAGTDGASTRTFCEHFGPRYYSVERGAVHYVVLDDVFWYGDGYLGYLDDETLAWLEQDLARVEPGAPVVVVVHIPMTGTGHRRLSLEEPLPYAHMVNADRLRRLLEPFQAHVLGGHTHENEHLFHGGIHEHVVGAACGAWWSGPVCWDGTPNGYAVYEVRGEELRWRYKATGHEAADQVRTYARGADPEAPDEIVANVWDWDPAWRVVWYEDGERRGAMARRVGVDPLSRRLHAGEDLPAHRPWVEPRPTAHLFYAPVAPTARRVRVEATDRFGRVHSAEVPAGV